MFGDRGWKINESRSIWLMEECIMDELVLILQILYFVP